MSKIFNSIPKIFDNFQFEVNCLAIRPTPKLSNMKKTNSKKQKQTKSANPSKDLKKASRPMNMRLRSKPVKRVDKTTNLNASFNPLEQMKKFLSKAGEKAKQIVTKIRLFLTLYQKILKRLL